MEAKAGAKRARLRTIVLGAAAVLAVALLLVGGIPAGGSGGSAQGDAGLRAAVIGSNVIYLNRSQTNPGGGPYYVHENVELNNSSTLTSLPIELTAISGCRWVSVVNLTENNLTASTLTKIEYANVTTANASGTVVAGPSTTSFKACPGNAYWLNFKLWTFGIYDFSFTGLGVDGTVSVTFGDWPGTTIAPATDSLKADASSSISLKVADNLTFTIAFPLDVNGTTTCADFGQVCTFPQYSFLSATNTGSSLVNKSGSIAFGKGYAPLAKATWSNWTVGYANVTVSDNTPTGAFFADVGSFWSTYITAYAAYWIFGLILIVIIAAVAVLARGRGRRFR